MSESNHINFNHLKIHSQYSICEGAAKIDDLQEYCKSNKIKSLGISDTSNLCGALEFAEKISKSGTQPIIGTQINFKLNDIIHSSIKLLWGWSGISSEPTDLRSTRSDISDSPYTSKFSSFSYPSKK